MSEDHIHNAVNVIDLSHWLSSILCRWV